MNNQSFNKEEIYIELRLAFLEILRKESLISRRRKNESQISHIKVDSLLPERSLSQPEKEQVETLICQIFHELYLERIIIPGTASLTSDRMMDWPNYQITEYGRQVLQTVEYNPYDPDGYLRRLKTEINNLDDTIIRYVSESLQCLRMNCLLAAAVTIGCASEQSMLLLIEQFDQAIKDDKKKDEYENNTSSWIITKKYRAFRKHLDKIVKKLPENLQNPLEQQLNGIYNLIRQIRNDAGHPTGGAITPDLIHSSHIGFPGYCKYVYSLIEHFSNNSVAG
jgi:hypothetical protein